MGVLKKSWLESYKQLSFVCICKYLNQKVRRIGKWNGKSFKGVSKTKKKKTKILSFITQFKTEFLLLLANCRKVLGKMTVRIYISYIYIYIYIDR